MKHFLIVPGIFFLISLVACNKNQSSNPPNGWVEKVNNQMVGKVSLLRGDILAFNCAFSEGRHIMCQDVMDSLEYSCYATVTYTDGTSARWQTVCDNPKHPLIYDDGTFSYFYGSKQNP